MKSKKGFQLTISMLVVIILGLALLGVGFSIFFSAYNQTVDIKERVDSQTAQQLNNLLDTGEAVVVPINSKEADRGDFVDFDLGISNELGRRVEFFLFVRFDSYSGRNDADTMNRVLDAREIDEISCASDDEPADRCADSWILMVKQNPSRTELKTDSFFLNANERYSVPIRIDLPRRVYDTQNSDGFGLPTGQYIFNVDIFRVDFDDGNPGECDTLDDQKCPRYFSRKKLYVRVQ